MGYVQGNAGISELELDESLIYFLKIEFEGFELMPIDTTLLSNSIIAPVFLWFLER